MGEIDLRRLRARLGNEEVRRQCLRGRQGNQVTTGQHGGTPVVGLDADTLPLDRGLPYLAKGRAWRLFRESQGPPGPESKPVKQLACLARRWRAELLSFCGSAHAVGGHPTLVIDGLRVSTRLARDAGCTGARRIGLRACVAVTRRG